MHFKRGELRNFRQHANLDLVVHGNLVGIVGPNGRGKSNLLASMQWALTGDVPGVVREKLLRWGETTGYALWEFKHNNDTAVVCRGVGDGPTWMTVNAGRKITGITRVNESLLDLVGIDKDIGRMIFVAQKMLDQVLFDLPSKREQAFQRLCGMGDAGKINRDIGNFISMYLQDQPDYDTQIAEAQRQNTEMVQKQAQLNEQLSQLDSTVPTEKQEQLEKKLGIVNMLIPLLSRYTEYESTQEQLRTDLANTNKKIQELLADAADTPLDMIDAEIDKMTAFIQKLQAYIQAVANYQQATQAQQALKQPPYTQKELDECKRTYQELVAAYHETSGRINLYTQLQKALSVPEVTLTECPVCGSRLGDKRIVLARLAELIANAQKEAAFCNPSNAQQTLNNMETACANYDRQRVKVDTAIMAAEEALRKTTMQSNVDDPNSLLVARQAELRMAKDVRNDIAQKQVQLTVHRTKLDVYQRTLDDSIAEQEKTAQSIAQLVHEQGIVTSVVTPSHSHTVLESLQLERTTITALLKQWQDYHIASANLQGQIKQVQAAISRIVQTIEDLEKRRQQQGTFTKVVGTLTNVRDFFHYTNGPHQLAVSVLAEMNHDVNTFLQQLNAPFSVTAHDAGLTYLVQYHDGRPAPTTGDMEATELSGGEKVLLAVSFRLASYMMFASKMGLLSLDEPSAYLDDTNIANFCELLGTLKNVVKSLDLQLIMATHERATIPFMDSIIDLGQETTFVDTQ